MSIEIRKVIGSIRDMIPFVHNIHHNTTYGVWYDIIFDMLKQCLSLEIGQRLYFTVCIVRFFLYNMPMVNLQQN